MNGYESYSIMLDDWLAIYTFRGGELDGHQAVRVTELWPEWSPVGERDVTRKEEQAAEARVVARARQMGPPEHDTLIGAGAGVPGDRAGWCGICARNDD